MGFKPEGCILLMNQVEYSVKIDANNFINLDELESQCVPYCTGLSLYSIDIIQRSANV